MNNKVTFGTLKVVLKVKRIALKIDLTSETKTNFQGY